MEYDDMFEELDQAIDWSAQFTEQSDELFAELASNQAGDETIQKLENLFQVAEHQQAFADLQRLVVQLGDLCCNPAIADMINGSQYFETMMRPDEHEYCSDDHDTDSDDSDKKKKKTARSIWALLFSRTATISQSA